MGQQVTLNRNESLMHEVTLVSTGERASAHSIRYPTVNVSCTVGTH
ncbi:MAG: hypothetical protein ACTS80_01290 [Candidatus Hodgkinia cicadicola]